MQSYAVKPGVRVFDKSTKTTAILDASCLNSREAQADGGYERLDKNLAVNTPIKNGSGRSLTYGTLIDASHKLSRVLVRLHYHIHRYAGYLVELRTDC